MRGARLAKGPHPHGSSGAAAKGFGMGVANHVEGKRLRKAKEDKKRKKQWKL